MPGGNGRRRYTQSDDVKTTHLLELEICPLVGHPFMPRTEFAL